MGSSLLSSQEEIGRLYGKYVDTVYRIALMMLKSIPEAEDATQAAFLQLMTCAKAFQGEEHIKAWLIVTVKNHCRDVLRSSWLRRRAGYDDIGEIALPDKMPDYDLWQKVMALKDKYKLPIYLYYYEGYPSCEIAEMLSVNHGTIRTRLKTARKKLKLMLEEETNEQ